MSHAVDVGGGLAQPGLFGRFGVVEHVVGAGQRVGVDGQRAVDLQQIEIGFGGLELRVAGGGACRGVGSGGFPLRDQGGEEDFRRVPFERGGATGKEALLGNREDGAVGVLGAAVVARVGRASAQIGQPEHFRLPLLEHGFADPLLGQGDCQVVGVDQAQGGRQIDRQRTGAASSGGGNGASVEESGGAAGAGAAGPGAATGACGSAKFAMRRLSLDGPSGRAAASVYAAGTTCVVGSGLGQAWEDVTGDGGRGAKMAAGGVAAVGVGAAIGRFAAAWRLRSAVQPDASASSAASNGALGRVRRRLKFAIRSPDTSASLRCADAATDVRRSASPIHGHGPDCLTVGQFSLSAPHDGFQAG